MKYVTFFGVRGGTETDLVWPKVKKWAEAYGARLIFREVTPAVRAEYRIEKVPTLRYFDTRTGEPRYEARLRSEIDRFLKEPRA